MKFLVIRVVEMSEIVPAINKTDYIQKMCIENKKNLWAPSKIKDSILYRRNSESSTMECKMQHIWGHYTHHQHLSLHALLKLSQSPADVFCLLIAIFRRSDPLNIQNCQYSSDSSSSQNCTEINQANLLQNILNSFFIVLIYIIVTESSQALQAKLHSFHSIPSPHSTISQLRHFPSFPARLHCTTLDAP